MALIEWNPQFSVQIGRFDDQHQKLVAMINQLHDGMKSGEGNTVLGGVLQSLITYTATHFAEEEKVMQSYCYPDLGKHRAAHAALVREVLDLQKKFQSGASALTMSLLSFLKNWLVNHIQVEDKKYGVYLNAKGLH